MQVWLRPLTFCTIYIAECLKTFGCFFGNRSCFRFRSPFTGNAKHKRTRKESAPVVVIPASPTAPWRLTGTHTESDHIQVCMQLKRATSKCECVTQQPPSHWIIKTMNFSRLNCVWWNVLSRFFLAVSCFVICNPQASCNSSDLCHNRADFRVHFDTPNHNSKIVWNIHQFATAFNFFGAGYATAPNMQVSVCVIYTDTCHVRRPQKRTVSLHDAFAIQLSKNSHFCG